MIYRGYPENELIGVGSVLRIYYQEYKGSSAGGGILTHNANTQQVKIIQISKNFGMK